MEKTTSGKELNVVILGSTSSQKHLVGNIILVKDVFYREDAAFDCEKGEGDVYERRVTLIKAPGWLPGYGLCDTPELSKTETMLSVTLCPPGLHGFILVINAELPFKDTHYKATREHLFNSFGDKVWDHTIVVFSHKGHFNHKTIEDSIRKRGTPLQSLLDACGNRYHILCDDGTDNDVKVKQLFEKIDAMVAKNSCYKIDSKLIQSVKEKRNEVDKKAEELRLKVQQQRETLRNYLTETKPNLRILMVGWVFSRKSASGNRILGTEAFQSGERTIKALKGSGKVAGREIVIVDTPGWWKFFPASFNSPALTSEIIKGVTLCSPSPNVILLAVPIHTSFTDEQRRITEDNMRLLGPRVWRHVIVLFTLGDTLGNKTIEQHIESEGKPLRWLIDKCENRYHVIDNMRNTDDQIEELLDKMEEMVAGNSTFYFRETPDPQPEEDDDEEFTENKDENPAREITEQLMIEWDRKNWERDHIFKGNWSMDETFVFSKDVPNTADSEGEKDEMAHQHEDDQVHSGSGQQLQNEDVAGSDFLNNIKGLMEREWNRREVAMEFFYKSPPADETTISEPDNNQLQKSRQKVSQWLKNKTSGYGTESVTSREPEEENEQGEVV